LQDTTLDEPVRNNFRAICIHTLIERGPTVIENMHKMYLQKPMYAHVYICIIHIYAYVYIYVIITKYEYVHLTGN